MPLFDLAINLLIFLFWCIVLAFSAHVLIKALTKIASFLALTEFVVGFIIMGVATSLPELSVGIRSALEKNTALALGTVIGSNIINLTLVIGVVTLLARGIRVESGRIRFNTLYMFIIAALPLVLMIIDLPLSGQVMISRFDGCILLSVFFLYILKQIQERKKYIKEFVHEVSVTDFTDFIINIILFLLGLSLLFISADFVVNYGTLLSAELLLPSILIGLFMVSFGTSLPELTLESRMVLTGHREMALGDLIGSVVANSTLVLGFTALICPIRADFLLLVTSGFFMLLVAFLFITFIESEKAISWQEGLSLILLYIFFVIIEFIIESLQRSITV